VLKFVFLTGNPAIIETDEQFGKRNPSAILTKPLSVDEITKLMANLAQE